MIHVICDMPKNIRMYTLMFSGFQASWRRDRKREKSGRGNVGKKGKSERGRSIVKKDFPTIYLHLRAVNNSRVHACRAAHSRKNCVNATVGLLFRRPSEEDLQRKDARKMQLLSFISSSHFLTFPFFALESILKILVSENSLNSPDSRHI